MSFSYLYLTDIFIHIRLKLTQINKRVVRLRIKWISVYGDVSASRLKFNLQWPVLNNLINNIIDGQCFYVYLDLKYDYIQMVKQMVVNFCYEYQLAMHWWTIHQAQTE